MIVHSARTPAPPALRGASAALGNLDGVHRGHQAVIAAARDAGAPLAAIVFEPHPRLLFRPEGPPFRLQTAAQRRRALAALGVDILFETPFDRSVAALTDEAFAREVLCEGLGLAHVAIGGDFRFGRDRMGDAASLARFGAALGFRVGVVTPVAASGASGERISSSAVRAAVRAGDMTEAARLLGRDFAIEGEVVRGAQRGRSIGFPTANLALGDYVRPRLGVYAARIDLGDGVARPAVANIGVKPTVGGAAEPLLEAHVFDFSGDLYGRVVEVALRDFLRDERRFDGLEALKAQIAEDAARARGVLTAPTAPTPTPA